MSNDSTKWLYDNLTAKGYNVGKDLAEFDSLLINNEDSRQWVYNTAKSEGWNVGKDYGEFSSLIAPQQYTFTASQLGLKEEAPQKGDNAWEAYGKYDYAKMK